MLPISDTDRATANTETAHEPVLKTEEQIQPDETASHPADSKTRDHGDHHSTTDPGKDTIPPHDAVMAEPATSPAGDAVQVRTSAKKAKKKSKGWLSPAKLFCPVSGRSHAALIDFDQFECPLCGDDLTEPTTLDAPNSLGISTAQPKTQDPSDKPKGDSNNQDADPNKDKSDSAREVSYLVECWGRNNQHFLGREPIDHEFDLTVARHGIDYANSRAFEIITVLHTTSDQGPPPPPSHFPLESQRRKYQDIHRDIIKDPSIRVWVHSTKILIRSDALIRLLRKFVRYYPSENLDGTVLQLGEPFALIAHHHEELEHHLVAHGSQTVSGDSVEGVSGKDETPDMSGIRHLRALLDYFNKSRLPWIHEEKSRYLRKMCSFRMLWLLYKPGDTVYIELHGQLSAFVVDQVAIDPAILTAVAPNTPGPYVISVWNLIFDGRHVGRALRSVTIAPFEGERKILSLRIIPASFFDQEDEGKTRQRLEKQGKWWYELLPGRQIYYSGPTLETPRQKQKKTVASSQVQETLRGRVYIDPASFFQQPRKSGDTESDSDDSDLEDDFLTPRRMDGVSFNKRKKNSANDDHPQFGLRPPGTYRKRNVQNGRELLAMCQCEECRGLRAHPPDGDPWKNYDILDPNVEKDLTMSGSREGPLHRYLLCDRVLPGFDLKSRTWAQLDVSYCEPFETNVGAIDNLVMPSERKDMIKALIQRFTSAGGVNEPNRSWAADFIENKGEGQIFLLHGGPGVGKTYVKCIAEYTDRPLLSLTCADIGTSELKMEQQLSKWFKLAEKWGAVMLIDEADVYLEQRLVNDLQRNSLVSVFLRCIEYYRGVLFLTTNRVGHFDDAFITRIHVIIRYDDLDRESCNKIWTQFFNKLDDEREDFRTTQRAKDYVLEDEQVGLMKLNGREIRNAFQTAVALAEFRFTQNRGSSALKQPTLDRKDFEQVCKMMQQFKKYMTDLHGDPADRAHVAGSRAHPGLSEHYK